MKGGSGLRVCWFSHTAQLGGAELALRDGVRALAAEGHPSVVVLPGPGPLASALAAAGAEVHVQRYSWWVDAPGPSWPRIRRTLGHVARAPGLAALVRRLAPDVVVSNTLAIPAGAVAARLAGVRHVWFVHEFGREDHGLLFDVGERLARTLVDRWSDRVLAVSEPLRDHLAAYVRADRLRVVEQAVEVPAAGSAGEPPGAHGGPLRLLQLAQKIPGKRQEDAVRAVAALAAGGVEVSLTLAGGGDPAYSERLARLCTSLGVADRVRFVPFHPQPDRLLAGADVVLVCSWKEAFGRVSVEAMKLGRPVVGARSGGTAALVRDGWSGLLYPPGDAAALAAAVRTLHEDRGLLATMGGNAREWAGGRFTLAGFGRQLADAIAPVRASAAG